MLESVPDFKTGRCGSKTVNLQSRKCFIGVGDTPIMSPLRYDQHTPWIPDRYYRCQHAACYMHIELSPASQSCHQNISSQSTSCDFLSEFYLKLFHSIIVFRRISIAHEKWMSLFKHHFLVRIFKLMLTQKFYRPIRIFALIWKLTLASCKTCSVNLIGLCSVPFKIGFSQWLLELPVVPSESSVPGGPGGTNSPVGPFLLAS